MIFDTDARDVCLFPLYIVSMKLYKQLVVSRFGPFMVSPDPPHGCSGSLLRCHVRPGYMNTRNEKMN